MKISITLESIKSYFLKLRNYFKRQRTRHWLAFCAVGLPVLAFVPNSFLIAVPVVIFWATVCGVIATLALDCLSDD